MFRPVAVLTLSLIIAAPAWAQMPEGHAMPPGMDHSQHQMMMGGAPTDAARVPTEPGQAAFATLQEIIAILEADPKTDWSKVNIRRLRDHLADMDDVIMRSDATVRAIAGGIEVTVSGEGRTVEAIRRMVVAHAPMLVGEADWHAEGVATDRGARLTVTADDAAGVAKIRALGFYGLMALGAHHQPHHLGMARGEMVHGG